MDKTRVSQTVIVTGAATGLGYAIADQFLQRGDNVVLNGRTEAKLGAAAAQLGHPYRVAVVAGDITQPGTAADIVERALKRFDRIDVLE